MLFEKILKDLVLDMQAKGAILLDWEGESVVHYGLIDEYDLKVIGAYQVIIHNFLKNISTQGRINFFQIKSDLCRCYKIFNECIKQNCKGYPEEDIIKEIVFTLKKHLRIHR
jgi:hypothetical protein